MSKNKKGRVFSLPNLLFFKCFLSNIPWKETLSVVQEINKMFFLNIQLIAPWYLGVRNPPVAYPLTESVIAYIKQQSDFLCGVKRFAPINLLIAFLF